MSNDALHVREYLRVNNGVCSVQPKVDHARERQVLRAVPHARESPGECCTDQGCNQKRLATEEPFMGHHPHAEEGTKYAHDGRYKNVAIRDVVAPLVQLRAIGGQIVRKKDDIQRVAGIHQQWELES